jgi:DNA-binding LacI/PurR family transcriptional regulator
VARKPSQMQTRRKASKSAAATKNEASSVTATSTSATPDDGSGRAPTLETVAARAGVSRATASRVVNHLDRVAPHVVASVNAAIEELGYVPNQAARSLARRRTAVVAVVIPESTERLFTDPFFAAVVQGAAAYLAGTDYTLSLVLGSNGGEKSRRYLTGGNVDGVLVVSQHEGDLPLTRLGLSVPIVFAGRPAVDFGDRGHFVDVDNRAAAAEAVRHLVDRGRTRIATIAGAQDLAAGRERLAGWQDALAGAGLAAELVAVGDFSPESGAVALEGLLAGPRFDAVFAANDQMAFGALSALTRARLVVPDDVAVVGFDDDQFSRAARPTITTIHQPAQEMGRVMAHHLEALMSGETVEQVTLLDTHLVVRESS